MPRVITTLQAMSHPTVVETINCLSEMSQRLQDENDELRAALAQLKQEPYGYFKAEPFGWVDCAETDDGAKALYEAPPQRPWVGLDHDELIERANQEECASVFSKGAIWGAARLREKNA